MKRNLRVILLLALVVLMIGVTALVASATEPADDEYFEVLDATGAHVSYQKTPANAVAAVTADGYTLKLLKDLDMSAATACAKDFTYTIDGGGHTITYKNMSNPARVNSFAITKGRITMKNFTIKSEAPNIKNLILFNAPAPASLTLENMTLEGGGTQITYQNSGNITFKGTGNVVGKNNDPTATYAISLKNASAPGKLLIEGGQFLARSPLFEAAGAAIEIRGGTFSNASGSTMFLMQDDNFVSAIKITDGSFTLSAGGSFFLYSGKGDSVGFADNDNALINISGGTFIHYGSGHLFSITASAITNKSANGGTMSTAGNPVIKISAGGTAEATRLMRGATEDDEPVATTVTVQTPYFDGWPDENLWEPGRWGKSQVGKGIGTYDADVFYINNSSVRLNIAGGTYIGSPYTYALLEVANAAAPAEINISGGSFMGARAWIRAWNASVWNISGTCEFSKPAPMTYVLDGAVYDTGMMEVTPIALHPSSGRTFTLDATAEGKEYVLAVDENGDPIYKTNSKGEQIQRRDSLSDGTVIGYSRATAGRLNITGGTFNIVKGESTCWISAAGADVNISGGTFNIGSRGIQMSNDDMISYVYISGGTFNGSGNFQIIYYSGSNNHKYSYDYDTKTGTTTYGTKYAQRGLVEISGGTFNTTEKCTAIWYESRHQKRPTVEGKFDSYIKVTGGTFHSDGIYLIYLPSAMSGDLLITDGTFDGTASRLVSLSGYKGQFHIQGGTFRLSALGEGKAVGPTDALIYIKTSSINPVLNIEGGTFINEREGADRLILFDSRTATLNLVGGKFMTRATLKNFLERNMNHGNMPVNADLAVKETIEGVEYTVTNVYAPSSPYAPTMDADVTIRLNQETPGIRFTSYFSAEKKAALHDAGATELSFGTLIVPREYLLQLTAFDDVHGALKAIAASAGVAESKVFADVVASAGKTEDLDGNVTFRAALVNISDVNKGYGAISYVKAKIGGQDVYYYSGLNTASNISTLKVVVLRELLDISDKPEEVAHQYVYKYGSINDDGYSRFTQAEQNFMRRLVAGK